MERTPSPPPIGGDFFVVCEVSERKEKKVGGVENTVFLLLLCSFLQLRAFFFSFPQAVQSFSFFLRGTCEQNHSSSSLSPKLLQLFDFFTFHWNKGRKKNTPNKTHGRPFLPPTTTTFGCSTALQCVVALSSRISTYLKRETKITPTAFRALRLHLG